MRLNPYNDPERHRSGYDVTLLGCTFTVFLKNYCGLFFHFYVKDIDSFTEELIYCNICNKDHVAEYDHINRVLSVYNNTDRGFRLFTLDISKQVKDQGY